MTSKTKKQYFSTMSVDSWLFPFISSGLLALAEGRSSILRFHEEVAADVFDAIPHVVVVGAGPVDLVAVRAAVEVGVVAPGQRQQAVHDLGLGHGLKQGVAEQAAAEGVVGRAQIKQAQDRAKLFVRVVRADQAPEHDQRAFQEISVLGEQNAALPHGQFGQRSVVQCRVVGRVEAERAEQGRQPPRVGVDGKGDARQRIRPQQRRAQHIEGGREGPDVHLFSGFEQMVKADLAPVGLDASDLGVGRSQRLDHVLDGGAARDRVAHRASRVRVRVVPAQQVGERAVEVEDGVPLAHGRPPGKEIMSITLAVIFSFLVSPDQGDRKRLGST